MPLFDPSSPNDGFDFQILLGSGVEWRERIFAGAGSTLGLLHTSYVLELHFGKHPAVQVPALACRRLKAKSAV